MACGTDKNLHTEWVQPTLKVAGVEKRKMLGVYLWRMWIYLFPLWFSVLSKLFTVYIYISLVIKRSWM